MASLDELLAQLGIGGVARNRAGQIVTNPNDIVSGSAKGLVDMLYGAGRGTVAGTAAIGGIPGDINQMYVNKFGALFPNEPAPPTSEQISKAVKKAVPPLNLSKDNTGNVATSLGENVVSPMIAPETLLGAIKATKYAAPIVGNAAENYANKTGLLQPIIPYEIAKNINIKTKLPSSNEFISAVENTPGARITEDGLVMRLERNQLPEQAGQESVRTGVFYLPEGSSNARYYKNATAGYGGKEQITGETLLKNPLFVKGATGGKVPEMAFDSIKGKGAMKELDADVNRIVMGSSFIKQKDPDLYQEMVSEFLQKYGSNPDTASYIIDNSKKGNQLKYALRENAIANTVRNAGYDAVLGYSKGKKGNFFSEVFDLRELNYPTKDGDFKLNPMFNR